MGRGRTNSVVAQVPLMEPGDGLANSPFLRALREFLRVLTPLVLFVYLLFLYLVPSLASQPEYSHGEGGRAVTPDGPRRRQGRRRASVEAATVVVEHGVVHHDGILRVIDEIGRLMKMFLFLSLSAMIYTSIASIPGGIPIKNVIRVIAGLSPVAIQAGLIRTEVADALCLEPVLGPGAESAILQCPDS